MMEVPDPEILAQSYLCIQREIFVNLCTKFSDHVENKDKNIYKRAADFSKDFNNCQFDFKSLSLNPENFGEFCNYTFDFMNYVRKLDKNLFDKGIKFAQKEMSFPNMPTLQMSVKGCGASIGSFLEMRENNELPSFEEEEDDE
jgi:hypothetical protein